MVGASEGRKCSAHENLTWWDVQLHVGCRWLICLGQRTTRVELMNQSEHVAYCFVLPLLRGSSCSQFGINLGEREVGLIDHLELSLYMGVEFWLGCR